MMINIEEMKSSLQASRKSIAQQAALIKQLEKAEKPAFVQTKVGRAYLKTLKFCTRPFSKLAEGAELALERPYIYMARKLALKLDKVLEKCKEIDSRDSKNAKSVCLLAASTVLEAEQFIATNKTSSEAVNILDEQIKELHTQVKRLRPERTKEDLEEIALRSMELFEGMMIGENDAK